MLKAKELITNLQLTTPIQLDMQLFEIKEK